MFNNNANARSEATDKKHLSDEQKSFRKYRLYYTIDTYS